MSLVSRAWENISPQIQPYAINHIINTSHSRTKKWKLHPRHQRYDYTWSDENRELYIDSLEKNIAQASTITLSVKVVGDIEYVYILDGGHRIDTILRYCGELGEQKMFCDAFGRKYTDFDADQKLSFDSRVVTVVTYRNLTDAQEDLLFMRINRHLTLSQGETINAMKSVPICSVAHEMSEIYKPILCDKKTGLTYCGDGDRMEEKAYMFVLCVNFILGKISIYEKPGTKVLTVIEKYRFIEELSHQELTKLKKNMDTLFNIISVPMYGKFRFYDLLVGQWLILNCPQDILKYKNFMKSVHMKNSIWFQPWKDAVKNAEHASHSRVSGLDEKNLSARVSFFKTHFVEK